MFNQGVFPNILKITKVIPVFKSGEKSLIENYRPISFLPVFSKVIEKLIKTRILSFINRHEILYDHQSGFDKKRSTTYPRIDVITECYDIINSGKHLIRLILTYCFTNWTIMIYVVHVTNSLNIAGVPSRWLHSPSPLVQSKN